MPTKRENIADLLGAFVRSKFHVLGYGGAARTAVKLHLEAEHTLSILPL